MAKMNILVLNSGSSSLKCSIYDFAHFRNAFIEPVWQDRIEWKNVRSESREQLKRELESRLKNQNIDCIGHRIVHGGDKYQKSIRIDEKVKREIAALADLAPLHNLADLLGIEVLSELFPTKPQVAVFDTAFHHTIPPSAAIYPGPYKWKEMGIHRFGFHGISFQYCSRRVSEMLKNKYAKIVICHLGSGASLCAVQEGTSIDTTMGFTPLEGLMMDTRSGSIDPGILLYLLEKKKYSVKELSEELYEKSGLLGISGISSDMRDILKEAAKKSPKAQLSLEIYLHRLTSMIGSMVAVLGGLDALVFTAGIGENSPEIRNEICRRLSFLGIELDEKISHSSSDQILSSPHSKVQALLIHTKEAFEIARECWQLLG